MTNAVDPTLQGLVARRARKSWIAVFVSALVAISLATHWPNVHVGDPTRPPDKIIHFIAFGGLTALLWQIGWIKSRIALAATSLAIAVADELTQSMGIEGRQSSIEDVIAGGLGIFVVVLGIWAFAPVGGPAAMLRQQRRRIAEQFVFSRLGPWLSLLAASLFGIVVMLPLSILIDSRFPRPNPLQAALVGAVLGVLLSSLIMLEALVRRTLQATAHRPRCTSCGAEALDGISCTRCGAQTDRHLFIAWPDVGGGEFLRLAARPLALAVGIVIAVTAVVLSIGALRLTFPLAGQMDALIQGRAYGMTSVLDLTLVASAAAVAVRSFRTRSARRADAASERCIECGYDLSQTPTAVEGYMGRDAAGVARPCQIGRCGECGASFLREIEQGAG